MVLGVLCASRKVKAGDSIAMRVDVCPHEGGTNCCPSVDPPDMVPCFAAIRIGAPNREHGRSANKPALTTAKKLRVQRRSGARVGTPKGMSGSVARDGAPWVLHTLLDHRDR